MTGLISVIQLGTIDYATGLKLQQTIVDLRKSGRVANVLLLLEHTPVITLGRNADQRNILAMPELLRRKGVEVFECDRGGDVTYHGPGQLVGYPIFDLRSFTSDGKRKTLGAVEYVRRVEEALIRTCADFGLATERVPKLTGVWTSPSDLSSPAERATCISAPPTHASSPQPDGYSDPTTNARRPGTAVQAKIAAIGVHISRGVTSHGFALNVNTDLEFFKLIVPCGIATKPVTSLSKEIGALLPLDRVAESVARNFGRVFNSQVLWVETLDALLGRSVGVPLKAPQELRKLHEQDTTWA